MSHVETHTHARTAAMFTFNASTQGLFQPNVIHSDTVRKAQDRATRTKARNSSLIIIIIIIIVSELMISVSCLVRRIFPFRYTEQR